MDKKKIFVGLGIVALIGVVYYFYNKSKKTETGKSSEDTTGGAGTKDSVKTATETTETTPTKPVKVLATRKDKKKACGRRPALKKKREEWQKCVDAGGTSEFTGDFDEFEESYLDFDNNFDISF